MNIILAGKYEWKQEELDTFYAGNKNSVFFYPDEEQPLTISPCDVHIIVCNWFFKYHDLKEFTQLKYIQLLSSGYNGLDIDTVRLMGIELHNAKNVYSIPISEYVIGNILAYYKKLFSFFVKKQEHRWEKNRKLKDLYDKKVLIIGTGSIGNEIAKRLNCFTQYIYGCNRTVKQNLFFLEIYALQKLPELIHDMDIIILAVALADDTERLISRSIFQKMKRDALIVNVSRGRVIDEKELISFLSANPEAGAILDVFEEEPLPSESPLWNLENALITPHNAFISSRNHEKLSEVIISNYKHWETKK